MRNRQLNYIKAIIILIFFATNTSLIGQYWHIKVKTPLCQNPPEPVNNRILNYTWDQKDFVNSVDNNMYSGGGLFVKTNINESYFVSNNYHLPNHHVFCMEIQGSDIFIGTDNGIYMTSYNSGNSDWNNANHYSELIGLTIRSISINTNNWFACTENQGIWRSTDNGNTWSQSLSSYTINCILESANNFYIASDNGLYKSTDNGGNWSLTSLTDYVNTLYLYGSTIYAGTAASGLNQSSNGGNSWDLVEGSNSSVNIGSITSIVKNGNNIYIGTEKKSFWRYNGSLPWVKFDINGTMIDKFNSMILYPSTTPTDIYAATDIGLWKFNLSSETWLETSVLVDAKIQKQLLTNMIYLNGNEFWVACVGDPLFGDAKVLDNLTVPAFYGNYEYWGNYNCHAYAWHYIEGGLPDDPSNTILNELGPFFGVSLGAPFTLRYVGDQYGSPPNTPQDWAVTEENWDYIKTESPTTDEGQTWNNVIWDKVSYDSYHSGVYYLDESTTPSTIKIISKWDKYGPLVMHSLRDHPWGDIPRFPIITFWSSMKKVSDPLLNDYNHPNKLSEYSTGHYYCCIGRQISTEGTTTVNSGMNLDFYVAPMLNHRINLKPGFHAEAGCNFHAFVKTDCQIPWVEDIQYFKIANHEKEIQFKKIKQKYRIELNIYPNPSSGYLTVLPTISGYEKECNIEIKIYSISGSFIKSFNAKCNVETEIYLDVVNSGSYLFVAIVDKTNLDINHIILSAYRIITIEK